MSIIKRIYWEKPSEKGIRIYVHLNAETDFPTCSICNSISSFKGYLFWILDRCEKFFDVENLLQDFVTGDRKSVV